MNVEQQTNTPQALLGQYQNCALLAEIDANSTHFPVSSPSELRQRQQTNERLCAYTERLLRLVSSPSSDFPICLLVDGSGYVLDVYHGEALNLPHSPIPGTSLGDIWGLDKIGPNAITIGLAEGIPIATVGHENYNKGLQDYAIYYAPILAYSVDPSIHMIAHAGIALIVKRSEAHSSYLLLAKTIAHDLVLNLHTHQSATWSYHHFGEISLSAGTNYNSEDNACPVITHYDTALFELFHVEPKDMFLQPLDHLIDPLPQNTEFWQALNERRHIVKHDMVLTVQGRNIACILTVCPLRQPSLGIDGFDLIITTVKQVAAQVASKIGNRAIRSFDDIITNSPSFRQVIDRAQRLSATESNILLTGESGVGKDIFAQAIHAGSSRRNGPFIAVNCAAIPRDLLASELFGYDVGAFTGAKRQGSIGKFELADGGTIFLDEIGDLPLDLQTSLLRVVEQKQFMRLGGSKWIDVDVKIISATNVDLAAMIQNKQFRPDLYYRLSTMQLLIPPLRQRDNDVVYLAEYFAAAIARRIGRVDTITLSEEAKRLLLSMPWPGNVRELQNLIERVVQLYPDTIMKPQHIKDNIAGWGYAPKSFHQHIPSDSWSTPTYSDASSSVETPEPNLSPEDLALLKRRSPLTMEAILHALRICDGNRTKAAAQLGISRKTLYRYLDKFDPD